MVANGTEHQYREQVAACRDIFAEKLEDYSPSWRILRASSVTDQILNKAKRIRQIEESGVALVDEGVCPEFQGIVNYSIIELIQMELTPSLAPDITSRKAIELYDKYAGQAFNLMLRKNHDYGEAWRGMRQSSITDLILVKLFRIKQIEDLNGKTQISEGIASNLLDILNYAVFSLIKLANAPKKENP